jgi:hypothetical protein
MYAAPTPFPIPEPAERPSFWIQLGIQLERNVLVTWRNKTSKIVDVCLIIIAVALSAGFEGTLQLTRQHTPAVSFEDLTNGTPAGMYMNMPQFFLHATSSKPSLVQFTMKLGVIASVLLALTATRAITAKRLEFFRESASGYNVNAYFAAINITGFFEYSFQMIIAGGAAFWLRNSISIWFGYVYNFLIIMWLTVSWSLLLPLVVPGNNVVLAAGFFTAFFSLLFSGGLPPIEYTGTSLVKSLCIVFANLILFLVCFSHVNMTEIDCTIAFGQKCYYAQKFTTMEMPLHSYLVAFSVSHGSL